MFKRTLAILITTLALLVGRAYAADGGHSQTADTAARGAEHASDRVGAAASPAAEGGRVTGASAAPHEGKAHSSHVEGDERLVPIPPSRDTIVSAVWVLIIFCVMLAILYKTAWKQVLAGLKAREQRIRQDITDAEAARTRAESTLREYNTQLAGAEGRVREMLAKASADAEKIATSIRMQAQQEAEEIKERTSRELDAARKQAMAEFRQYAATVATSAAEQILRRNLNEQDQLDLVNRSLDQLESVNA